MNILLLLKKKKKNFLRRRKTLDLETVILSEVRQTEKHKYVISLTCGIGKKKKDTNEPIYKAEIKGFPGGSMVKKIHLLM